MTNDPRTPAGPLPAGTLNARFGDRWDIRQQDAGIWTAEHRDPDGQIRYIAAHSPSELASKLEAAEAGDPPC